MAGKWLTAALVLAALVIVPAAPAAASPPTLPAQDPFYAYSGPLTQIEPGTVLRTRTIQVAENGTPTPLTATQVLYRTTGELGQPTVTVATVLKPALVPTKIVSYQTAYDALGSECDPSYTLQGGDTSYSTAQAEEQIILGYLAAGYTVVVPDYEGEQLDWGAGQESGYGTLDGIRAAETLTGADPHTTPVGMVGYSGGSIATEYASELQPTYAPELDLVGTAAGGVPVDFWHNLAYINGSPSWSGVIPAVLVGLGRAFDLSIAQYLSPYGAQITGQVQGGCINNFLGAWPGLTYQQLVAPQYQDIYSIRPLVTTLDHLIMSDTGTPKGPLLLGVGNADGTGDGVMVAKDVQALAYAYCQRGVSVQFSQYNGDDHTQAAIPFEQAAFTFLTERLAGLPTQNGCSSIGPGNSLAPVPPPPPLPPQKRKPHRTHRRLHFRYLGARGQRLRIELWATAGTLRNLAVTLREHGHLIARLHIAALGSRRRVFLLRDHGRGTYRLAIAAHGAILRRLLRIP
jgi:secretory lipase